MKSYLMFTLALAALGASGCMSNAKFGTASLSPGRSSHVEGNVYGSDVIAITAVTGNLDIAHEQIQLQRECVRLGRCGYGGYGHYPGVATIMDTAYVPVMPAQGPIVMGTPPAPQQGAVPPPQGGNYATKQDLECVDAKANDALGGHAGKAPKGLPPHCKK